MPKVRCHFSKLASQSKRANSFTCNSRKTEMQNLILKKKTYTFVLVMTMKYSTIKLIAICNKNNRLQRLNNFI